MGRKLLFLVRLYPLHDHCASFWAGYCFLIFSTLMCSISYIIKIMLYSWRTETRVWDHKLMRKVFKKVTNRYFMLWTSFFVSSILLEVRKIAVLNLFLIASVAVVVFYIRFMTLTRLLCSFLWLCRGRGGGHHGWAERKRDLDLCTSLRALKH